jgi:hypothetical protein
LINTGGHGSLSGDDPTHTDYGEGQFIQEDIKIAMKSNGRAAVHIVSPGAKPLFPE